MTMQAGQATTEQKKKSTAGFMDTLNEAITLKKNFSGNPDDFVPCLECGKAIPHEHVTELGRMLCDPRCKRRFSARMKAGGRNTEAVLEQAHTDAFGVSRGSLAGRMKDTDMLPDREALLLMLTNHLKLNRQKKYEETRGWFRSAV